MVKDKVVPTTLQILTGDALVAIIVRITLFDDQNFRESTKKNNEIIIHALVMLTENDRRHFLFDAFQLYFLDNHLVNKPYVCHVIQPEELSMVVKLTPQTVTCRYHFTQNRVPAFYQLKPF